MTAQLTIPARFNGPPASGNGGYSCGVIAAHIEGPARVRLHVPPPLDTELQLRETEPGSLEMYHGDTLVGSGYSHNFELQCPTPPTPGPHPQAPTLCQSGGAATRRERHPHPQSHTGPVATGPARVQDS